jgi:hypothetical protein
MRLVYRLAQQKTVKSVGYVDLHPGQSKLS